MASVGAIAAVTVALMSGGPSTPDLGSAIPPLAKPAERDPGGKPNARITLPPRKKWFGFNSAMFIHTGRGGSLDLGVTPEGTARDAAGAGANSGRIEVVWSAIEPEPGRYDEKMLAVYDRYMTALQARGGRPLLLLGGAPRWIAKTPDLPGSPPRSDAAGREAFARYAAFVAERWPQAVAIETWNEPNGRYAWAPKADPAGYARLHKAARDAIRSVNPEMKVVLGGLATPAGKNPDFMGAQLFLKRMYGAGLRPADYDGIALHPYANLGPIDKGEFAKGIEDARLGYAWIDPDPAIWITETGVTTSGPYASSPKRQAQALVRVVRKLLSAPRVEAVYVHTLYDLSYVPATSPDRGFGIMRSRGAAPGRPKPAYRALAQLASAR